MNLSDPRIVILRGFFIDVNRGIFNHSRTKLIESENKQSDTPNILLLTNKM